MAFFELSRAPAESPAWSFELTRAAKTIVGTDDSEHRGWPVRIEVVHLTEPGSSLCDDEITAGANNTRKLGVAAMETKEQQILVIHPIADGKARYLTAKKLTQLFRDVPFSEWKAKLDSGGETVVMRSEDATEFEPYRRSLEMLGVETGVIEQKVIGGAKVF